MSVVPLYEGYTRGKNLDKIRTMMNENGLNMVIFESGNKVGKKVGNGSKISDVNKEGEVTLSMYDKDMNFNPSYAREISKGNYEYSTISNMGQAITDFKQVSPWKYFGVQVETNNQKNKNIFGTQMRVLGLIDLMEDPDIDKKAKAMFSKKFLRKSLRVKSLIILITNHCFVLISMALYQVILVKQPYKQYWTSGKLLSLIKKLLLRCLLTLKKHSI